LSQIPRAKTHATSDVTTPPAEIVLAFVPGFVAMTSPSTDPKVQQYNTGKSAAIR